MSAEPTITLYEKGEKRLNQERLLEDLNNTLKWYGNYQHKTIWVNFYQDSKGVRFKLEELIKQVERGIVLLFADEICVYCGVNEGYKTGGLCQQICYKCDGVTKEFAEERSIPSRGSNYTPPKKKRKRNN